MPQIASPLESLAALAHAQGGWGYAPGQAGQLESTCLALLALSLERDGFQADINGGLKFLEANRAADDSYRLAAGRPEAVWPTALVLFTRAALGAANAELRPTALRLLTIRGQTSDDPDASKSQDIDIQIIGWPWAEGNFSWVEPTAWACMALRRTGFGKHAHVVDGERLLLDRTFDEGGSNYGNRLVFGRSTEPAPGPTALMLLALQGRSHARIDASLTYLEMQAAAGDDLEHLCWTKLVLHAHGRPAAALDERIVLAQRTRFETTWVGPAVVRLALTALALGVEQSNPFKIQADESTTATPVVLPPVAVRSQTIGPG